MMLTKDVDFYKKEAETSEVGMLTNRFFNILTMAKAGKLSIPLAVNSLQAIGEGWSIVEDMFTEDKPLVRLQGFQALTESRTLLPIEIRTGKYASHIALLLDSPVKVAAECGIRRCTFARTYPVPAEKVWARILEGREDVAVHWKRIDSYGIGSGAAFPISQANELIQLIHSGKSIVDINDGWPVFIFCQFGPRTGLLKMTPEVPLDANRWSYSLHDPGEIWFERWHKLILRIP